MNKYSIFVCVSLGIIACGSPDSNNYGQPGVDFDCQPIDRSGTYLIEYRKVSGNCGQLDSSLARFDVWSDNCEITAPDLWSDNQCTLERSLRCIENGIEVEAVGITTQQDPYGDVIKGRYNPFVTNGVNSCSGIYDMKAIRQ